MPTTTPLSQLWKTASPARRQAVLDRLPRDVRDSIVDHGLNYPPLRERVENLLARFDELGLLVPALVIETSPRSRNGRDYLRLVPTFYPDVTGHGVMTFGEYHAWVDQPETHAQIRATALANARTAMTRFLTFL